MSPSRNSEAYFPLSMFHKYSFVSGHGFIRAAKSPKNQGFSPWGGSTNHARGIYETRSSHSPAPGGEEGGFVWPLKLQFFYTESAMPPDRNRKIFRAQKRRSR